MASTNLPDLNVRELSAIVALAERGSFVAAARLLGVSLPTLSRTVKRVEKVVGVTLFERSTRRVAITPAGRAFVGIAQRLLSELQLSIENLGEVAAEQRGRVVIAAFSTFAHEVLPSIFSEYLRSRPEVQLHVQEGQSSDIVEQVIDGRADFGITYVDIVPDTIHRINLRREPIYVVMSHEHPLARGGTSPISFADLVTIPLVSLPQETYIRRIIDSAAGSARIWLKQGVIVPSLLDVLNHASAGVGVGLVPSGVISDHFLVRLRARPLQPPSLSVSVGLVVAKGRHVTPAASSLMRFVLERVRAQQTPFHTEFLASSLAALDALPVRPYGLSKRQPTAASVERNTAKESSQGKQPPRRRAAIG